MATADFNYEDFQDSQQRELDKHLLVKFYYETRPDKAKTEEEGRPVFKEVEYVDIRVVGKKNGAVCRPARQDDVERFPEHYRRFRERIKEPEVGTPLSEWPPIGRSTVETLSFSNIKTVEQLAEMSDSVASQIMGGFGFKEKAKAFLEYTKETKKVTDAAALEKKNQELQEQIDVLMARLDALDGDNNAGDEEEEPVKKTAKKSTKKTTKKVSAIDSALNK
jgi:hypothetical protein